jgi:hypothetical protein
MEKGGIDPEGKRPLGRSVLRWEDIILQKEYGVV